MTRIRVLRDQPYSDFVLAVAKAYPEEMAGEIKPDATALEVGTVIGEAVIDDRGKAHYIRPDDGEPYYSPLGWYEVIE